MHFNWIFTDPTDQNQKARSIEMEYVLRPKIIRFLLERVESECCGDFSCFHFDVFIENEKVVMANKTPDEYIRLYGLEFDRYFNNEKNIKIA